MKISIVTISYNQARYLPECLDSVLGQQEANLEYIVVDPGSTDGSREVIDRYAGRLRRVYDRDRGAADGLNKGFALATGSVFGYLNSDDVLMPGALARVRSAFERDPQTDVIIANGWVIDDLSQRIRKCHSDPFSLLRAAYGASIAIQPSTFFRREIFFKAGGFNAANRSNWDGELLIDMALAGARVRRLPDFLSCYRVHSEGITGSGRLEALHKEHSARMFKKIVGRDRIQRDLLTGIILRGAKHLLNPSASVERILHGPIFAAKKKSQ